MLNWWKTLIGEEKTSQKRSLLDEEFGRNLQVELDNKQKMEAAQIMNEMLKNKQDFAAFPALLGLVGNPGFANAIRELGETIKDYQFLSTSSSAEVEDADRVRYEKKIAVSLRALDMIVPSSAQSKEELTSTLELYVQAASQVGTGKTLSDFDVKVGIYGEAVKEVVNESSYSPKPAK